MKSNLLLSVFALSFLLSNSCDSSERSEINRENQLNKHSYFSRDIKKLISIMNLNEFIPDSVFYYVERIDNSGQTERSMLPGPSDERIEGVLFFDSLRFNQISKNLINTNKERIEKGKTFFQFVWLNAQIKKELQSQSESLCVYNTPAIFSSGKIESVCLLKNKLLFFMEFK